MQPLTDLLVRQPRRRQFRDLPLPRRQRRRPAVPAPPAQDDFRLEILGGPGAAAQPRFGDVDASLSLNGYNHVCLSVDSVDDTLAELRRRGVDIVNPPFEIDDISARLAFFRDPWGNMFEISERIGDDHAH
ncbi:VOC family protein [Streptosporangium sp. G12]